MTLKKLKRHEIGQIQFIAQSMRDLQSAASKLEMVVAEIFESKGLGAIQSKQAAKLLLVKQEPIMTVLNQFNIKAVS